MNQTNWLPLIRSSGSTLGEAITRLAELAEAAHLRQVMQGYHAGDSRDGRADGPAPQGVVAVPSDGADHTEVDR